MGAGFIHYIVKFTISRFECSSLVQNIFLKKGWKAIFLFSCIDQYVHCKWDKDTDQMVWWPPYLQECNRKLYLIFEIAQKFLISGLCHYYSCLNPIMYLLLYYHGHSKCYYFLRSYFSWQILFFYRRKILILFFSRRIF